MVQITLNYTPGSCSLVPHALMLFLNINFILNHVGDPPTDTIDNDFTFP